MKNNRLLKIAAVAAVITGLIFSISNIFITGYKFCDKYGFADAAYVTVSVSEDIGEEFTTTELTDGQKAELYAWLGKIKLMKTFSRTGFDVDSLRVIEINCYRESGELYNLITVFGNSYIKSLAYDDVYKILS